MLVSGYSQMKPFLPAVEIKSIDTTIFNDALEVAQDTLVNDIIGTALEEQLERRAAADAKFLRLCQRVVSLEGFMKSIPELDLVLTDSGFGVVSNESVAPASKERVANLTAGLQRKLDETKDALVTFLMKSDTYSDWRGTEQFDKLSDGLIMTFSEFKTVGVLNAITKPWWPETWKDFLNLNSALNVALMSDIASYISKDYAEELLEDLRGNEALNANEQKALRLIKIAIAALAMGDRQTSLAQAIKARRIMLDNLNDFPTFAASPEAEELTNEHKEGPMFSMF